jgi:DNA-binding GntR family transcriptional regulator
MISRHKTSDAIADVLVGRIVRGELRPGDRIDLAAVAAELDVSRAPLREALILLERDGLVDMPLHRGAFVAQLGVEAVREGFTLYALLSALTVRTVVGKLDAPTLDKLEAAHDRALASTGAIDFERHAREFRRIINVHASGPHLRSLLRTFNGLVRSVSLLAIEDAMDSEREYLSEELVALRFGDLPSALDATVRHVLGTGEQAIRSLRARGVFDAPDSELVGLENLDLASLVEAVLGGTIGAARFTDPELLS